MYVSGIARAGRTRRNAAAEFSRACALLPLAIGIPFALMFMAGIVFNWI